MHPETKSNTFSLFIPALSWINKTSARDLMQGLSVGFVGAILAFPQAIALATLAGVPPIVWNLCKCNPCFSRSYLGIIPVYIVWAKYSCVVDVGRYHYSLCRSWH